MKRRSIVMMIVLTIITFGIYSIYWTCSFQNQLKKNTGKGFGGFGHLLALMFTFGIYGIYWQYAAGRRLAELGAQDNSTIYVVLVFVFLSWLNKYFMQSQANQLQDRPAVTK